MIQASQLAFRLALAFFVPSLAWSAPEAALQIAQAPTESELAVGSTLVLEAKITGGNGTSAWTIDGAGTGRWLSHGPLLLDLRTLGSPAERASAVSVRAVVTQSGASTIPPLILRLEGSDQKIETNPLTLNAQSVLGPDDKEPIWILPLLPYGSWNKALIATVCGLLLVIGAGALFLLVKRIRRKTAAAPPTPLEKARREIAALEAFLAARPELGIAECKKFSFDLSALLRRYASSVYSADFLDLTDKEVARKAEEIGMDPGRRGELAAILDQISEVRYSRKLIAADAALKVLKRAGSLTAALNPRPLGADRGPGRSA